MRKRNIAIMFRLNRKEAEALDKKVKKSGLNREAYLRQVITGIVPRDAPPPDYYSMMRELHKVGNNLNQIAQKAHVLNGAFCKTGFQMCGIGCDRTTAGIT